MLDRGADEPAIGTLVPLPHRRRAIHPLADRIDDIATPQIDRIPPRRMQQQRLGVTSDK